MARPRVSATLGIALACSVGLLLVASVRFARFDWTGLPLERGTHQLEREVGSGCTEVLGPYTTSTGRTISPVTVDDTQYLSLVEYFSGVPRDRLQVDCLLSPWVDRPAVPWLAAQLPVGDEAVALALVNLTMTLVALWAVVFTLRAQGVGSRPTLVVGLLFAVSWNTLLFASATLVDAAVVALVALSWWFLALRRPWWVVVVLLVSYPLKETTALLLLPVLAAWLWADVTAGRRTRGGAVTCLGAGAAASVLSFVAAAVWFPVGEATWQLSPSPGSLVNNLFSPASLFTFLLGTLPLFGPALLHVRDRVRATGWRQVAADPAVVGISMTAALVLWVTLAADLSSRFAWVGTPFAASLAAAWLESGSWGRRAGPDDVSDAVVERT